MELWNISEHSTFTARTCMIMKLFIHHDLNYYMNSYKISRLIIQVCTFVKVLVLSLTS